MNSARSLSIGIVATLVAVFGLAGFEMNASAKHYIPNFDYESCRVVCPDGYTYYSCTPDGHPINYFADPCMFHQDELSISSISPSTVEIGDRVTLEGSGFARRGNTIHIGSGIIRKVSSSRDGTRIKFRMPRRITLPCYYMKPRCLAPSVLYQPGTYDVWVEANGKTSNKVQLTVVED